jgi:hypothetical protein
VWTTVTAHYLHHPATNRRGFVVLRYAIAWLESDCAARTSLITDTVNVLLQSSKTALVRRRERAVHNHNNAAAASRRRQ